MHPSRSLEERAQHIFAPERGDRLLGLFGHLVARGRDKHYRKEQRRQEMHDEMNVLSAEPEYALARAAGTTPGNQDIFMSVPFLAGLRCYAAQPYAVWRAERGRETLRAQDPRFHRTLGERSGRHERMHERMARRRREHRASVALGTRRRHENPWMMLDSGRVVHREEYEAVLRMNAEEEEGSYHGSDISDEMERAAFKFELEMDKA